MVKVIHSKSLYLLFLAGLFLPVSNVFADDPNTTDFSVTVTPVLSLSIPQSPVNLQITPNTNGMYGSTSFNVTSATNNMYGYTLTMTTENDHTYLESDTVDVNTGNKPQIQTLTATQTGISVVDFQAATTEANGLNRYGIAFSGTNYVSEHNGNFNAVASPTTVHKSSANNTSSADTTSISLASKLNLSVPAGTYRNKFIFQLVANPVPGGLEDAYQNAGKTKKTINGKEYYAMQDMTSTICSSVALAGDVIEVYDSRDDTIYHIGKLEDNKCWLLDNLALDLAAQNASARITSANTNASQSSLNALFGIINRDPSIDPDGNLATAGVVDWVSGYSYSVPMVNVSNRSVLPTTSDNYGVDDPMKDEVVAGEWKVGGYYNYCAASAGSYCYDSMDTMSGDASEDICPAGWRMPSGGATGDYVNLANSMNITLNDYYGETVKIVGEPAYSDFRRVLRLPLSGSFINGSAEQWADNAYIWLSNYGIEDCMQYLDAQNRTYNQILVWDSDNGGWVPIGNSVRCIAK